MEQVSKPHYNAHPNADILHAIADGKKVQYRGALTPEWIDYVANGVVNPIYHGDRIEWRIKPEEEPLFQRWYIVETRASTDIPALNYSVQRASLEGLSRLVQGNPDLRQNLVGFLCMSVDVRTVRKVEFFSKAELKAKGVL